jgi:hypothetical protein
MTPLSKNTILIVAIPLIALFWLGSNQARLSKRNADLQEELLAVRARAEREGEPGERTRRRVQGAETPPVLTAIPKASEAEVASLRKKLEQKDAEVSQLRETVSQLQQARPGIGVPFSDLVLESGVLLDLSGSLATGRRWGQEQVVGEPDTQQLGDLPTAWAPKQQNGGEEWLQVEFENAVALAEINVHETHNPGAISKVAAILPDGSERLIWEGDFDQEQATDIVERAFQVRDAITANSVKIYLDTARVPGWNEIDAVELVGADQSRQWAASAKASSTYAQ